MSHKAERLSRQAVREAPSISLDLRSQFETMPPDQRARYTRIEQLMGFATLDMFQGVFNPDQQAYLTSPVILILNEAELEALHNQWNGKGLSNARIKRQALNGKVYATYHFRNESDDGSSFVSDGTLVGKNYRNGRISVFVASEKQEENVVDEKFLSLNSDNQIIPTLPPNPTKDELIEHDFLLFQHEIADIKRAIASQKSAATQHFAGTVVHEKIHGLQNSDIPKPIKEIQAYYFEREVMKQFGYNAPDHSFSEAMDFYGELVNQYGPDVHKVIFGSASKSIKAWLLPQVLKAFENNFDRIFPDLEWEFIPVD